MDGVICRNHVHANEGATTPHNHHDHHHENIGYNSTTAATATATCTSTSTPAAAVAVLRSPLAQSAAQGHFRTRLYNHHISAARRRRHRRKRPDTEEAAEDSPPPPPPSSSSSSLVVSGTDSFSTLSKSTTSDSYGMERPRGTSGSISSSVPSISSQYFKDEGLNLLANPFELRHGRRYLRDLPYPLPCDLAETHRQNLRTLLGVSVFGKPVCSPNVAKSIPSKVLEVGCGAAYWSSTCHDWFADRGRSDVSFTGVDIAPLSPDLGKQGMTWRFVQHDLRRLPWPFEDEEFDFVMCKDMSLAIQVGMPMQQFVDEMIRITSEGGISEFWESDHTLRCLRPHPPPPPGMLKPQEAMAAATKTYLISPSTPFAPAQNKYVVDSNMWICDALDGLQLPPTPCARMLNILYQEAESWVDVGFRRVAVPLGELRWEKEGLTQSRRQSDANLLLNSPKGKGRASEAMSLLTPDQAAIRYTALLTILQKIESLEPVLKDASGKNSEEWSRWWAGMMAECFDQDVGSSGEVLEIGAWWATKRTQ